MMRVLQVYKTYYPDPPGGLQEAIRQISLATKSFNIETKIFTLSKTPNPQFIDFPEARVIRCRSVAAPASCDLGGIEAIKIYQELVNQADIIHYHFPWPFADILHKFVKINKPAVMTYHSDIVRQRYLGYLYQPLMRQTLRSMKRIVATSENYAQTSAVLQRLVQPQQLQIIPLAIKDYANLSITEDIEYLVNLIGDINQPFILTLGVLRYYKGLHILLAAAKNISAKIVIAGSGFEAHQLKKIAQDYQLKNVIFAGQISTSQKQLLLKYCYLFVLASHLRSEAFGMVLVEAAMFGKAMICCELGTGTSFINLHQETGLVIEPNSPVELAKAINYLLDHDSLVEQMGKAARERYLQLFSAETLGKSYNDLYQLVLDDNSYST
ncbi:MAG: hypothetical protein RL637_1890 [Pseudomonadota bacterium]|jgi:rhamnosyl/mannosyltransferase